MESADFSQIENLLTPEEIVIRNNTRKWVTANLRSGGIKGRFLSKELLKELGKQRIVGGYMSDYGCPGWTNVGYGLAIQEIAKASGSLATFLHIQSAIAVKLLHDFGSSEQRALWIPSLLRCELIAAFALTEPEAGSDAAAICTEARPCKDGFMLTGDKRWIGNATFADCYLVCAKVSQHETGVFIVERCREGLVEAILDGRSCQFGIPQGKISLKNCFVPLKNRLPGVVQLKHILSAIAYSRYGVSWDALGQAWDCYTTALEYATTRKQFNRPLASFQLTQAKLVEMLSDLSAAQVLAIHVGRQLSKATGNHALVSFLKMHCASRARRVASIARDVLGANGLLRDFGVIEHMQDLEAVYTYEGTHDINMLIVGHAITGIKAYNNYSHLS